MKGFLRGVFYFVILLVVISFFRGGEDSDSDETELDLETRKLVWIEQGKDAVKALLKDSDSAKFRSVFFNFAYLDNQRIPVTCGEVNAKNSFGGFAGFEKFVSAGKVELTYLESQMSDFHVVWNKLCR